MTRLSSALALVLLLAATRPGAAQAPAAAKPVPADSARVAELVAHARAAAGTQWAETVDFFCGRDTARANRADDPELAPARVFDNLYALGRTSTVIWAIKTPAGIALIDAGYPDQVESVLLPGLRKLGLDPNDVKLVLLAHGHADHFGGAAYFQQRGARVALSGADWDLMQNPPATPPPSAAPSTAAPSPPPANAPSPSSATALPPPRRDLVVIDGQPLELGGLIDHARLDPRSHAGLARLRVQGRGRRPSAHGGALWRLDLALVANTGRRARAVRELRRALRRRHAAARRRRRDPEPSALRRVRGEARATLGAQTRRRPSVRRRRGRLPELPNRDGRLRASRARATQGRNALKLSASAAPRACPCRRDRGSAG